MINVIREPLIFEISSPGKTAFKVPVLDVPEKKSFWLACLCGQTLKVFQKFQKLKLPGILLACLRPITVLTWEFILLVPAR